VIETGAVVPFRCEILLKFPAFKQGRVVLPDYCAAYRCKRWLLRTSMGHGGWQRVLPCPYHRKRKRFRSNQKSSRLFTLSDLTSKEPELILGRDVGFLFHFKARKWARSKLCNHFPNAERGQKDKSFSKVI